MFDISEISKQTLIELRNANIELKDEDIITIYELGKISDKPSNAFKFYSGVILGSLRIFPLSIGARLWYLEEARELSKFNENIYSIAFIYALCHAYEPEMFLFQDPNEFYRCMVKFGKKIDFTETQLIETLKLIGEIPLSTKEGKKESKQEPISPILSFLLNNFGKDIHYWTWDVSESTIMELINGFKQNNSNGKVVTSNDPNIRAYIEIRKYVERLKKPKEIIEVFNG